MKRCFWVDEKSDIYVKYHDEEWGIPKYDDRELFELLILESFQAGLSWITVLKKRGMKYVGTVIIYSYLQAIGVADDHDFDCFRY